MFLGGERVQSRIKPMVVCISGLDPTGGAGIQADIETLAAMDCFALPIISSLTVQTTSNVLETHPVDPHVLRRQFDALIESGLEISAIKLGLIDSAQTLLGIAEILKQYSQIPVIADPVLKAGGGYEFVNQQMIDDYIQHILPRCLVLTPNIQELKRLFAPVFFNSPPTTPNSHDSGLSPALRMRRLTSFVGSVASTYYSLERIATVRTFLIGSLVAITQN
jgi:hydroxymethylpyrimidine/phosphomethylpyrimidine kinase